MSWTIRYSIRYKEDIVAVKIMSAQPGTGEEGYDTCISEIGFF